MTQIKVKYLIVATVAILNIVFFGGWKLSRVSYESVSDQIISTQTSLMNIYEYRVGELEREATERESVIASQRALIKEGVLAKEELKKLKIKHLSEITKVSAQLDMMLDSIKHTGVITVPCPEQDYLPALYLPFRFKEQNEYLNLVGEFDEDGILSMNLSVPVDMNIFVGKGMEGTYKAVVTTDNPYLRIANILSVKTDIPDPHSRWGIGVTGGLGVPLCSPSLRPFVGIGVIYSLIQF